MGLARSRGVLDLPASRLDAGAGGPGEGRTGGAGARSAAADSGPLWVLRRALADLSEAQFFGNEWASAALLVGAFVANADRHRSTRVTARGCS